MNLPETKTLLLSLDQGVLHLTLNRPESRNAMNRTMVEELTAVFDVLRDSRDVRAVVMRGAGGHFCAGGDLKEMMAGGGLKPPQPGEADPVAVFSRTFGTMLRKAAQAPQVVVAVLEGAVLAGGFGLACVSDIALAQVDAKFGVPETTRGLPPAQIAPFIVERIGLTQARRLCLTGAQFKGAEALRLGLVHDCYGDEGELQSKLSALLEQILGCAPGANAMTKEIIFNAGRLDMDEVLDDAARKFAQAVRGGEAPEGITAFMQKRKPRWAQGGKDAV
ncbi:MAG: enoyl-CoA hydratase-related protein [Nevskia sp.]|nr:enoyl-CoA hydratase-related protein [Nevskia sp.]